MAKKFDIEKELERLENIVNKMNQEEIPLNEVLALYNEGMKIAMKLSSTLENLRGKIEIYRKKVQSGETIDDEFFFEEYDFEEGKIVKKSENKEDEGNNIDNNKIIKKANDETIKKDDPDDFELNTNITYLKSEDIIEEYKDEIKDFKNQKSGKSKKSRQKKRKESENFKVSHEEDDKKIKNNDSDSSNSLFNN